MEMSNIENTKSNVLPSVSDPRLLVALQHDSLI